MENILYELKFNFFDFLICCIPLFLSLCAWFSDFDIEKKLEK